MEKKKKSSFFCCGSSTTRRRIKKEQDSKDSKEENFHIRKGSTIIDKVSSVSSSDNIPENTQNKSNITQKNEKQKPKIPRNNTKLKSNDITEITNKSNSNLISKSITPLIPDKNILPNTELNKSSGERILEIQSEYVVNTEIKTNLANKFEEVAENFPKERRAITTENENFDVSDLKFNSLISIPKESKPIIAVMPEIKNICDPAMYVSNFSKEKFSFKDGEDFTFKKSMGTDNKNELLTSINKNIKQSPEIEINKYNYNNQSSDIKLIGDENKNDIGLIKNNRNTNINYNQNSNNDTNNQLNHSKSNIFNLTSPNIQNKINSNEEIRNFNLSAQNNNNISMNRNKLEEGFIRNKEIDDIKLKNKELNLYKKLNDISSFTVNKFNNDKNEDEMTIKKSFVSYNLKQSNSIYSNLINQKSSIIDFNGSKNNETFRIEYNIPNDEDINEIVNKSISKNNTMFDSTYVFPKNLNNITLNQSHYKKEEDHSKSLRIKDKDEITIDINSFDNKSFNPSSECNSASFKEENKKENEFFDITDEIEPEEEVMDERENVYKSDNKSVISSKIMSHINTPKMLTDIKTSTENSFAFSNFNKSEYFNRYENNQIGNSYYHSKIHPDSDDYECEIMQENTEGYNNFIDTPKSSHLSILKNNSGSLYRDNSYPKNLTTSYNFNHPHLKDLNDRLSHKEKEMKKINAKINQVMSDLLKYEEENKKYEKKIKEEEAEGQILRHFLNFLTTHA